MSDYEKAMTLRLPAEMAGHLETIAAVQDKPMSGVIREAITEYLASFGYRDAGLTDRR